jgi:hypothetical protein
MKQLVKVILLSLVLIAALYAGYMMLPHRHIALGVWTQGFYDAPNQQLHPEKLLQFESMIDRKVAIAHYYKGWEHLTDPHLLTEFQTLRSNGWQPMINVNPYYFSACPASEKPLYKAIAQGQCDAFLHSAGQNLSHTKEPFFFLFAWEMNNKDLEWSIHYTRSSGQDFIAAWRHMHDIFEEEHATNVIWVFAPNTQDKTSIAYKDIYPGADYIDWTGIDGYNWGTTQSWSSWSDFKGIFTPSYRQLVQLAPDKPMMISEVNTTDQGGNKAAWYQDMFINQLPYNFPKIKAIVIYDEDRSKQEGVNWKVNANEQSLNAFKAGVHTQFYK